MMFSNRRFSMAATFFIGYGPPSYTTTENACAHGGKPSAAAASLLDSSLTSGKKSNYVFTYNAGKSDASGKINTYTLSVQPVKWHPGLWNFFDDDSGIIRGTQENRAATVNDPPLQ